MLSHQVVAHLGDGNRQLGSHSHIACGGNSEGDVRAFINLVAAIIGGEGQGGQFIVRDGASGRGNGNACALRDGRLPLAVGQHQGEGLGAVVGKVIIRQHHGHLAAGGACRNGQGAGDVDVVVLRHGAVWPGTGQGGIVHRHCGGGCPRQADGEGDGVGCFVSLGIGDGQGGEGLVIINNGDLGGNAGGVAGAVEVHHCADFIPPRQLQHKGFNRLGQVVGSGAEFNGQLRIARREGQGAHDRREVSGCCGQVKGHAGGERLGGILHRDGPAGRLAQRCGHRDGGAFCDLKPSHRVWPEAHNGWLFIIHHHHPGAVRAVPGEGVAIARLEACAHQASGLVKAVVGYGHAEGHSAGALPQDNLGRRGAVYVAAGLIHPHLDWQVAQGGHQRGGHFKHRHRPAALGDAGGSGGQAEMREDILVVRHCDGSDGGGWRRSQDIIRPRRREANHYGARFLNIHIVVYWDVQGRGGGASGHCCYEANLSATAEPPRRPAGYVVAGLGRLHPHS